MTGSLLTVLGRYVQTIRYLHPRQCFWRPYLRMRRQSLMLGKLRSAWKRRVAAAVRDMSCREPGPLLKWNYLGSMQFAHHIETADAILKLEFRFLNQTKVFATEIDWNPEDQTRLWKYNLHYQSYFTSLAIAYRITGNLDYFKIFKTLVLDWIEANPLPFGDAWHPYVVSLRVANWICVMELFNDHLSAEPGFSERFLISLVEQVLYVANHLERDVGGNHLIANLKALCLAAAYFSGPLADKWLDQGLRLLEHELPRQVLPDGGHFERSPMYHAIVLEDLLMIAGALRNAGLKQPAGLKDCLIAMVEFLRGIVHPDGEIPLFNDAALGSAPTPGMLFRFGDAVLGTSTVDFGPIDAKYALFARLEPSMAVVDKGRTKLQGLLAFPSSGYYVIRKNGTAFLMDLGQVCPDELPAHAHADIFSYELSIKGKRWVVDSGVREYTAGEWRDFARSTRAHNTVALAGRNQVDVWASFRVGRRVKPESILCQHENGATILVGRHRGFGRFVHTRVAVDHNSEMWLIVDEISGTGNELVENFIHFHPGVSVELGEDGAAAMLNGNRLRLIVTGHAGIDLIFGEVHPLNGWYMPDFGLFIPNPTVRIRTYSLPSLTAYLLTTRDDIQSLKLEADRWKRSCVLGLPGQEIEVHWDARTLMPQLTRRSG